MKFMRKNL